MLENRIPKCSRRRFLQLAGVGGAAWVVRPGCLLAAEKPLPKLSFLVVSDTHLGYHDKTAAAEQWKKTAAEIAKSPANLVLHLGDVVDGGRESQYPIYLKIRESIPQPIHEIPGNHDPRELFEKHLRKPVDTTVDHHWLRFLLLNNARTDSHDGFLSKAQLEWIEEQCERAGRDEKYVALCMHVPAHTNRHPDRGWHVKPANGQTELYEILKQHNQPRAVPDARAFSQRPAGLGRSCPRAGNLVSVGAVQSGPAARSSKRPRL